MGKHVYCQKPLTHTVYEARADARGGQEMQGRPRRWATRAPPRTACARRSRSSRPAASAPVKRSPRLDQPADLAAGARVTARPKDVQECPKHVHWDLFLGPAPERPYTPGYHPFNWRGWWDFGTGALGDMACHTANMAFMALKLGYPTSVVAESGE